MRISYIVISDTPPPLPPRAPQRAAAQISFFTPVPRFCVFLFFYFHPRPAPSSAGLAKGRTRNFALPRLTRLRENRAFASSHCLKLQYMKPQSLTWGFLFQNYIA